MGSASTERVETNDTMVRPDAKKAARRKEGFRSEAHLRPPPQCTAAAAWQHNARTDSTWNATDARASAEAGPPSPRRQQVLGARNTTANMPTADSVRKDTAKGRHSSRYDNIVVA